MEILQIKNLLRMLGLALLAFVTMGYHPGLEDDHVYLAAIKSDLNPRLYPHDAVFFRVQLQATIFDKWMAGFVQLTRIPVAYSELLWQIASIVLILLACWSIARELFDDEAAQWTGVALVGAMLTLPVAGTALTLADQHLHPRNLATGLILLAIAAVLRGKRWHASALIVGAIALHPIMAAFGVSFCVFLMWALSERPRTTRYPVAGAWMAAVPLGWLFEPPNADWHRAIETRSYYFLGRWTWYEWLGAIAPVVLFWLLRRFALRSGQPRLAQFARAVVAYGLFQQAVALAMLQTPALLRLTPLQPMRYLHLIYFCMVLVAGCLLGKVGLRRNALRWLCFLAVSYGGMFAGQRALYAASAHLELPWTQPTNPWVQAFAWIRQNTPEDAYFALDPEYMREPGEDYHSFRALAERSQLADAVKDAAVVTQVPGLGSVWTREVAAQTGWKQFGLADFERLKTEFGVHWVVLNDRRDEGLRCVWHKQELEVCQIP